MQKDVPSDPSAAKWSRPLAPILATTFAATFATVVAIALAWSEPVFADLTDEAEIDETPEGTVPATGDPAAKKPTKSGSAGPGSSPAGADRGGVDSLETDSAGTDSVDRGEQKPPPPRRPSEASPTGRKKPKSGSAKSGGAKNTQKDLPINFKSQGLRGSRKDGVVELLKDVVVRQGEFRLDANRAKVYYDEERKEIDKIIAKDNVKVFTIDPKTGDEVRARGNKMTFDQKAHTITISGNARLWRGDDLFRGRTIKYNIDTGWMEANRVDGVVNTGDDKP